MKNLIVFSTLLVISIGMQATDKTKFKDLVNQEKMLQKKFDDEIWGKIKDREQTPEEKALVEKLRKVSDDVRLMLQKDPSLLPIYDEVMASK